eukprot:GDKI01034212.1.p1 GENE.GDKI01034212.1~~GDKI01034212.1.p1  ORF type:complete len:117 (+),score=35.35 GDKI01034212.1:2-352(+)
MGTALGLHTLLQGETMAKKLLSLLALCALVCLSAAAPATNSVGRQLSDEEIEDYRKDFVDFDLNGDGKIDAQEVRMNFKSELQPKELYKFFMDVDQDDSGTITMEEYIDYAITLDE